MAATCLEGEQLCAAIMTCQKCKPSSAKNQVEEVGYELADMSTSTDVTGECASSQVSKQQQTDSLRCRTTTTCLDDIYMAMQEQQRELCEYHEKIIQVHNQACNIQEHAVDVQECMSLALLDILHQSLLPPHV